MATLSTYVPKPKIDMMPNHTLSLILSFYCKFCLSFKKYEYYISPENLTPEKSRLDALWYQSGSHQKNRNYSRYYRRGDLTQEIGHTKREWRSWSNWKNNNRRATTTSRDWGMSQRDGITGTRGVLVNVQHQALWKTTKLVCEFMWCKYPGRADFKLPTHR